MQGPTSWCRLGDLCSQQYIVLYESTASIASYVPGTCLNWVLIVFNGTMRNVVGAGNSERDGALLMPSEYQYQKRLPVIFRPWNTWHSRVPGHLSSSYPWDSRVLNQSRSSYPSDSRVLRSFVISAPVTLGTREGLVISALCTLGIREDSAISVPRTLGTEYEYSYCRKKGAFRAGGGIIYYLNSERRNGKMTGTRE